MANSVAAVADIDPIQGRAPLIENEPEFHDITETVSAPGGYCR